MLILHEYSKSRYCVRRSIYWRSVARRPVGRGVSGCATGVAHHGWALRAPATIDVVGGSSDESGIGGGQIGDKAGDLIRRAVPGNGQRGSICGGVGAVSRIAFGVDRSWLDEIDGDAPFAKVARQAARQSAERRL